MFYFYNNGITFICDSIQNSPNSRSAKLDGASIVNGCQTVTSLFETYQEGKLNDNIDILVRITKISDYDQRAKITQYLNSQTPIKDSYFVANHSIVRELQNKLFDKKYYLERQINEATYKEKYENKDIKKGMAILKLDDVIQYYSGYYLDKFAATSKRSKSALFSPDYVEEILSNITPEKVIYSYNLYQDISKVITAYRRYRRNKNNTDFIQILGVTKEELEKNEENYLFINTADILILNTCKFVNDFDNNNNSVQDTIVKAIFLLKKLIQNSKELHEMSPAGLTKNQKIYSEVAEYYKNKHINNN